MSLESLFCDVDDFCQRFLPFWPPEPRTHDERRRRRSGPLSGGKIMTIMVHFHPSHDRPFKAYYLGYVRRHLKGAFPG